MQIVSSLKGDVIAGDGPGLAHGTPEGNHTAIRHFYILAEIDFHLHGRFKKIKKSGALNSRTISAVCVLFIYCV